MKNSVLNLGSLLNNNNIQTLFSHFSLQVSKIAAYAYSAISQIKVDAKEELVVQFAIP